MLIYLYLKLLLIESQFRSLTIRLIIEDIKIIIMGDSQRKKASFYNSSHEDSLNDIYYIYLNNIKLMILNNHFIKETSYNLFCSEWKEYNKDFDTTIDKLIHCSYLLMSYNLTNDMEGKFITIT